jgi:hypothetical protein
MSEASGLPSSRHSHLEERTNWSVLNGLLSGNRSVATGISYLLTFESSVVATLVIDMAT